MWHFWYCSGCYFICDGFFFSFAIVLCNKVLFLNPGSLISWLFKIQISILASESQCFDSGLPPITLRSWLLPPTKCGRRPVMLASLESGIKERFMAFTATLNHQSASSKKRTRRRGKTMSHYITGIKKSLEETSKGRQSSKQVKVRCCLTKNWLETVLLRQRSRAASSNRWFCFESLQQPLHANNTMNTFVIRTQTNK